MDPGLRQKRGRVRGKGRRATAATTKRREVAKKRNICKYSIPIY